jgi:hypothetical protein
MNFDIVVCGGGIAGAFASIAAARRGGNVLLCEKGGTLGGSITASQVGFILDAKNKDGLIREFIGELDKEMKKDAASIFEIEKYLLEKMCVEAGVHLFYHSTVTDVKVENGIISSVEIATPKAKLDVSTKIVIDATGNGDVAAMSGCEFELGNDEGKTQPMSVLGTITGLGDGARKYVGFCNRHAFKEYLESIGVKTSMGFPNMTYIGGGAHVLSINHEYGVGFDDGEKRANALIDGRRELYDVVRALKESKDVFENIALISTPELIGIREGRRIKGRYCVSIDDVISGREHEDAVCKVTYWVDIHALDKNGNCSFFGDDIECKPYDIPFRAQLPIGVDNLILAGRCISGDFFAHASYRVAGNMACTGEAAGIVAQRCVAQDKLAIQIDYKK